MFGLIEQILVFALTDQLVVEVWYYLWESEASDSNEIYSLSATS